MKTSSKRVPYQNELDVSLEVVNTLLCIDPRPLVAFSGGKDSVVVAHIMASVGVRDAVMDSSMTFLRAQRDAVAIVKALGLSCEYVDRFGRGFVAENTAKWLFRPESEQGALYGLRQQATVKRHAANHGFASAVYGRRTQENTVPSSLYKLASGLWQCNPLRAWSTDQIWTYIADHGLPVPEIYTATVGKLWGATPWPFMDPAGVGGGVAGCWDLMVEFCPETATEQSKWFHGAREALARA